MLVALSGCPIRTGQGNQLETNMTGLEGRIAALEQQQNDLQSRFDASTRVAGEAVVGFDQIQQELGILQGRLDEADSTKQLSPEQITLLRRQLARQFETLDSRLATLEKKAGIKDVDRGNIGDFGAAATAPVDDAKPDQKEVFAEGVAQFNRGNLEAAKARFREYLKAYPKGDKAPEAQYYLAESHFKQRNWEEAILAFDTLTARYPRSERIPVAYLHMGLSFYENGQRNDAKLFFDKVIEQFPRSKEAAVARKKIQGMK